MAKYLIIVKNLRDNKYYNDTTQVSADTNEEAWTRAHQFYGPHGHDKEYTVVGVMSMGMANSLGREQHKGRPAFDRWVEQHLDKFYKEGAIAPITQAAPGPKRPPRQVVPEIEHIQFVAMENKYGEQVDVLTNTRKVDPDAAMKAIRDMCSPVQVKK